MSQYGIDISEWQPDPAGVIAEHNPDFVILKLSQGRGYTVTQEWLTAAVTECRTRKLPMGFYHFAEAGNPVTDDISNFMSVLARIPGKLQPGDAVALDYEEEPVDQGWCNEWLLRCKQLTGRTPLFYSFPAFTEQLGGPPIGYPLWLAHINVQTPAMPCAIWQFTWEPVDTNKFDGDDIGKFFLGLNPSAQGAKVPYGVIINNPTDFQMARDTLHVQAGLVLYDKNTGKDLPNKLYVGGIQMPQKPYDVDPKGNNWVGFTGRGGPRTKKQMEWIVKAIHAVGPPPMD